jgi:hypothetical protein
MIRDLLQHQLSKSPSPHSLSQISCEGQPFVETIEILHHGLEFWDASSRIPPQSTSSIHVLMSQTVGKHIKLSHPHFRHCTADIDKSLAPCRTSLLPLEISIRPHKAPGHTLEPGTRAIHVVVSFEHTVLPTCSSKLTGTRLQRTRAPE